MVELGMATALRKPTFLFRDDFRRAADSEEYPLSLMLFTRMPEHGWRDYYYTTLDEITVPNKALARLGTVFVEALSDPALGGQQKHASYTTRAMELTVGM